MRIPMEGEAMASIEVLKHELLQKLPDLSEEKLWEVIDFVDFLRTRERPEGNPILEVAGILSGRPLSAEEIEEALYGKDPA